MTRLPDLDALRLLVMVANLGSIGAAARAAGVSQQSASERLRTIEAEVGLSLLQRSPSGSELTSPGRLLVEWSVSLLAHADQIDAALATLREDRSRQLHVHASMTTAEHLVPRWMVVLRRERSVQASMSATNTTAVLDAVRAGEADIGFIEGPGDLRGLAHRTVGHDELRLVAAPDDPWSTRRRPLLPGEVAARALTSREPGSGTRQVAEDAYAAIGHPLAPPEAEMTTTAAILSAVRAGSPPAFVSDLALVDVHDLAVLRTDGVDLRRRFTAVWVGSARPPAGPLRDLLAIAARPPGPAGRPGPGGSVRVPSARPRRSDHPGAG